MGIESCIDSLKCKGICLSDTKSGANVCMFLVYKIRGTQKSYYSDFIVSNSDVDDHLEALGYFSGVVSIYCLLC